MRCRETDAEGVPVSGSATVFGRWKIKIICLKRTCILFVFFYFIINYFTQLYYQVFLITKRIRFCFLLRRCSHFGK